MDDFDERDSFVKYFAQHYDVSNLQYCSSCSQHLDWGGEDKDETKE